MTAPPDVLALLQQGNRLFGADPEAGLAAFERALALAPGHPSARACVTLGHVALATRHAERGAWEPMFTAYRRAIEVDPSHAGARFGLAVELLRQGAFAEGWREYEWRWRWKDFADAPRGFTQPLWRGEPLRGTRILLHAEQGLGDAIQFARYAPLVAARGGEVILEVPKPLVRLMRSLPGVSQVVMKGEALPPVAWQCPLMSLPLAFGTTLDTIPAGVPYLTAEPAPLAAVDEEDAALRVGIVWAGNPGHKRDDRRSMPLGRFAPLAQIPGIRWYSLQFGPAPDETRAAPWGGVLVDLSDRHRDFADTAALMAGLDLVITVDTSAGHLAGALGRPVWILVSTPGDWRWLLDRDDTPWYPSARLFRQDTRGDWSPVIRRVGDALTALVLERGRYFTTRRFARPLLASLDSGTAPPTSATAIR